MAEEEVTVEFESSSEEEESEEESESESEVKEEPAKIQDTVQKAKEAVLIEAAAPVQNDIPAATPAPVTTPAQVSSIQPERFNPSPLAHILKASSDAKPVAQPLQIGEATVAEQAAQVQPAQAQAAASAPAPTAAADAAPAQTAASAPAAPEPKAQPEKAEEELEESSEEYSSDEESESEEEESKEEVTTKPIVEANKAPDSVPAKYVKQIERFNPSPHVASRILKGQEVPQVAPQVPQAVAPQRAKQEVVGKVAENPERFNPTPLILANIIKHVEGAQHASAAVTPAPAKKVEADFESESESESEEESSEEESEEESEEDVEAKEESVTKTAVATVIAEPKVESVPAEKYFTCVPERFNPSPFVKERILPPSEAPAKIEVVAPEAIPAPKVEPKSEALPEAKVEAKTPAVQIDEEESEEEDSDEEESVEEYESSEEESGSEEEESDASEVDILATPAKTSQLQPERFNPSPNVNTLKAGTSSSVVPAKTVSLQPERFNPSPNVNIIRSEAPKKQESQKVAAVSIQPERFNPSPNVNIIRTESSKKQDSQQAISGVEKASFQNPERFNPSPHVSSKIAQKPISGETDTILTIQKAPATVSFTVEQPDTTVSVVVKAPPPAESRIFSTLDAERFNPAPLVKSRIISHEGAVNLKIAPPDAQPTAFEKLKLLLENSKQLDLEESLFSTSADKVSAEPDVVPVKPDDQDHKDTYRGPRTAQEYLDDAARKAEEQALTQQSPHVMVVRHLVAQQQRLHDMLTDMRHQFGNAEWQVSSIRNERFNPPTTLKKKHPWSKLIR